MLEILFPQSTCCPQYNLAQDKNIGTFMTFTKTTFYPKIIY